MARKKFKFVEMFIDPATGAPYADTGSPKLVVPKNFPPFIGHQIARIVYEEKTVKNATYTIKNGKSVKGKEEEVVILIEKMGEKGGWLEQTTNLSQDGECWVESGGIVCGNGFVGDDVRLSSGEVGENAKVCGKATIGGAVGIGGNAYVYGHASIGGSQRIAVTGTARVCGKVEGEAVVSGSAYVGEEGTVGGSATVKGNAQVFGKVEGEAVVQDAATVYGTVKGKAEVGFEAIILKDGVVDGNAVVESGIVEGTVKGDVKIAYGQTIVAKDGVVDGKASISGNSYVACELKGASEMEGNASAHKGGNVTDGKILANGTVKGSVTKSSVEGGAVMVGAAAGNAVVENGARVGENGNVKNGTFTGSSNIGGNVSTAMEGNAVVAPEASCTMELSGNQVFLDGDNTEPDPENTVICEVDPG